MPIGWYLAQGLIPLGHDSSDDEEGPCELPNGRLVCGPHGLVSCGKCCVDYSFMDDVLDDEDEDEDEDMDEDDEDDDDSLDADDPAINLQTFNITIPRVTLAPENKPVAGTPNHFLGHNRLRRGTGRVFPKRFNPPSASITPSELFTGRHTHIGVQRETHRDNPNTMILRTDGACLNNGKPNPKAGWAFTYGYSLTTGKQLVASGRLEKQGPLSDAPTVQSSNRAELRAVIAALGSRFWPGEGFRTCVVATDSEYVTEGATKWAKNWIKNGWTKHGGDDVKNKDLWKVLLGAVERWKDEGMDVQFWRIPREWNAVADAAAKKAAEEEDAPDRWMEVMTLPC